jgi:glycosyltransferase involved in cell wall biosynthesis
MYIVNILFSRGGGGIEQAFVDYCEGLQHRGTRVTAIVFPGSIVGARLKALDIPIVAMRNLGEWDPIASYRLRKHLQALKPDIVIAHANRAYGIGERAARGILPVVAVAQNYHTRRFTHADAVFATTHDLIAHLVTQGVPEDRVYHVPNMVTCRALPQRGERHDPPIIGAMGRFVAKKGFAVFIDALSILKARNYAFKAILGGKGEESDKLKHKSHHLGLDGILSFPGWIENKSDFYTHIDIFCLPSLHEPFGIVLLEAFAYGAPVVATDSEGPCDITTPHYDALIVKMGSASEMADAIGTLLDNPHLASELAANAFAKIKMRYSPEVVCEKIEQSCKEIIGHWKP